MGTFRFILALAVVIGHAGGNQTLGYQFIPSDTAVQCFYIISGFLITMVLNEREAYSSVLSFYASRYIRLWPTYIVVAILTFVLFKSTIFSREPLSSADWPTVFFIIFSNITLFFQDWFLFLKFDESGGLTFTPSFWKDDPIPLYTFLTVSQAWTLGVELVFYAIAPLFCRTWWRVILLLALGLLARYIVTLYVPLSDPWNYRFAPSEMVFFALGGLSYFIWGAVPSAYHRWTTLLGLASVAGLTILVVFWYMLPAVVLFISVPTLAYELYISNGGYLLLTAVAVAPIFQATKNWRWDRWIGGSVNR